jgi:hypothetical protein
MKNIFYLLAAITFASCDREPKEFYYNFKIENNSGKDIVIKSYNTNFPSDLKTFAITTGSSYSQSFKGREFGGGSYLMWDVLEGDSIVVNYNNNERKEIFVCKDRLSDNVVGCDEPRNIISYHNPTNDADGNINTTYTFTVDDYNNAND